MNISVSAEKIGGSSNFRFSTDKKVIELGKNLNMTLVCAGNGSGLLVFCGEERIIRE